MTAVAPTSVNFKLRFPEFADSEDVMIDFALEEAALVLGTFSGVARDLCQLYLAAHLVATAQATADSEGREVISDSIGRISQSYARGDTSGAVQDLDFTFYGKRYKALRQVGISPLKVVGCVSVTG